MTSLATLLRFPIRIVATLVRLPIQVVVCSGCIVDVRLWNGALAVLDGR